MPQIRSLTTADAWRHLAQLRHTAPLIHVITNDVVTGFTANVLLALGAAPAMVTAPEEAEPFAAIAHALSVNVGTLNHHQREAITVAIDSANTAGRPWVLDPVAVGVLDYRTRLCRQLLSRQPAAIRGNASEILVLAGENAAGKGVDSVAASDEAVDAAAELARRCGAIVIVSGATDYITDGHQTLTNGSGDPLMTRVIGTGCALSSVVAAFIASQPDHRLDAAWSACHVMGLAGADAARASRGPGSFVPAFLDALYAEGHDAIPIAEERT